MRIPQLGNWWAYGRLLIHLLLLSDSSEKQTKQICLSITVCQQGEQCNIVPDNVDDIVADIAQEEKEEGQEFCSHFSLFFYTVQD